MARSLENKDRIERGDQPIQHSHPPRRKAGLLSDSIRGVWHKKAVKELKVVGAYKQNFENKPSQLLNKSINEK